MKTPLKGAEMRVRRSVLFKEARNYFGFDGSDDTPTAIKNSVNNVNGSPR